MGLTVDGTKGGVPSGMPGVYINNATILEVKDISGETPAGYSNPIDIGLDLLLDIGRSFTPTFRLQFGFKKDEMGKVTGWGGAFKVQSLLKKMGFKGLTDENKFPPELLLQLKGRKIWRLSYVKGIRPDGKLNYSDWNEIWFEEEDPLKMAEKFKEEVKKGYPKNYHPEFLEQAKKGDMSFPPPSEEAPWSPGL